MVWLLKLQHALHRQPGAGAGSSPTVMPPANFTKKRGSEQGRNSSEANVMTPHHKILLQLASLVYLQLHSPARVCWLAHLSSIQNTGQWVTYYKDVQPNKQVQSTAWDKMSTEYTSSATSIGVQDLQDSTITGSQTLERLFERQA